MDALGSEERGEGWGEGRRFPLACIGASFDVDQRKIGPSPQSSPRRGEEAKAQGHSS
jgi:hypothetical protein